MRRALALGLISLCFVGCRGPAVSSSGSQPRSLPARQDSATRAASSAFDFYLLNLSWSPEYCRSHPGAVECARHSTFVLHGLWPERADGSYPEHCSDAPGPADPSQYSDIYPDAGLVQHEWQTHGTCSGLSPAAYFAAARSADQEIKPPLQLQQITSSTSMTPDAIAGLFQASNPSLPRSSIVISCGNNDLTAVEVCLSTSLQPVSCGAVHACRAQTVRIAAP